MFFSGRSAEIVAFVEWRTRPRDRSGHVTRVAFLGDARNAELSARSLWTLFESRVRSVAWDINLAANIIFAKSILLPTSDVGGHAQRCDLTARSRLAPESPNKVRRPIHAWLFLLDDQSSSSIDKGRTAVTRSASRMANCGVRDENERRSRTPRRTYKIAPRPTRLFDGRRDLVTAAGHFAQFPWPRLRWGVRSPLGTAVGRKNMSAGGERTDTRRTARASWRLLAAACRMAVYTAGMLGAPLKEIGVRALRSNYESYSIIEVVCLRVRIRGVGRSAKTH